MCVMDKGEGCRGKCHYGGVIIGEYASTFMCRGSLAVPEEIDCPQALT